MLLNKYLTKLTFVVKSVEILADRVIRLFWLRIISFINDLLENDFTPSFDITARIELLKLSSLTKYSLEIILAHSLSSHLWFSATSASVESK